MDNTLFNQVAQIGASYGIDKATLYSIIMNESGGNPQAHNVSSLEDSRGLFQINIKAHPDANSGMLFDGVYNASYIMPELAKAYNQGKSKGLNGEALASYTEQYGERPQWTQTVANNIAYYYNQFTGGTNLNSTNGVTQTGIVSTLNNFWGAITGNDIMNTVKFDLTYAMLFILLLFALYMVFIKK